jgi:hypothetical protein
MMTMTFLPFVVFWALIFVGRSELGFKGITFCIVIWVGLLLGFTKLSLPSGYFVAAQALIDVILILVIFGGDIHIR